MLKVEDNLKGLDIEIELTDNERGILASSVKQQGFDIMQKLLEDQVRRFNLKLINTNPSKTEEVLAAHYLAKAVAQFYMGFIEKLQHELQIDAYNNRNTSIVENSTDIPELQ